LILLDIAMPVLDGWGFLTERFKDSRLVLIPVVIISGSCGISDKAKVAGATAVLVKPLKPDQLLPVIDQLMSVA
jgi:CheY-like chemotaxis protein